MNKEKDIISEITEDKNISSNNTESQENKKEFNYYDKNIKKNKYYKELEKEANEYLTNPTIITKPKGFNLVNIHKPIIKLLIIFLVAFFFVNHFSAKTNKYAELTGLWGDEKGNYYEIYNETFEMNSGDINNPFYIGKITNVINTDTGYIILIKGVKYKYVNDEQIFDKEMELIFEIKNYSSELKTVMNAKLGEQEYEIIRLENTPKKQRQ